MTVKSPPTSQPVNQSTSHPLRILGIDPGLQRTGWGVVAAEGNRLSFIGGGVISTDSDDDLATRLQTLHAGIAKVVAEFAPQEAAIEETFVNKSGSSSLKLGQARGALVLSLALHHLPVAEYAANLVKKSVCGSGHADKTQISRMVQVLLPGCRALKADAMDALAVAICHAHHRKKLLVAGCWLLVVSSILATSNQ